MITLLLAVLIAAAYWDIKYRRIPNTLIVIGFMGALAQSMIMGVPTLVMLLWGLVVGQLIFMPFYLMSRMGAGDVKLLSVVGAYVGVKGVIVSALLAGLAGGLMALGYLLLKPGRTLPYAVAILGGVSAYWSIGKFYPTTLWPLMQGVS